MRHPAEQAFRRYYGEVYRYLLRRTGDPSEAEELTQRVFADAAAAEQQLERDPRPMLPWLLTVAHRRWVDERRRSRRQRDALETVVADTEHARSSDDELAAEALRRVLAQLSDDQREVVIRRLWRGRSFREIASELDLSEGAVKMRFRRGLESLRELLREEGYAQ
ncbi:MAG TPA: RNA polymerase sigma factor [Gaiellaceae bacterium]|nr:RNA polymerase sigma factor [Gaiellaceae bacterium]